MTTNQIEAPRRIVVGFDGSTSSCAAVDWAVHQAELTGSALEVLTTWEWPNDYGWTLPLPSGYAPGAESQKMLDAAVEPVRRAHPGVEISTRVREGHPAPSLVEASKGAGLLVVGSRGHGEFAGMLLGSVSEHCVANAHCPVLVFRDPSRGP